MTYKKNIMLLVSWKGSLLFIDITERCFLKYLETGMTTLAENELQTSMMYDQTGSRISLNNEVSELEDI